MKKLGVVLGIFRSVGTGTTTFERYTTANEDLCASYVAI